MAAQRPLSRRPKFFQRPVLALRQIPFFRPRPARRGSFRLVVEALYYSDEPFESLATSSGFSFDADVLEAALRRIYDRNFQPMTDIEQNLFHEFWRTFNRAADQGFAAAVDPDEEFRQAIRHSNAVFAAFKTHRMQNDMAALLLDSNGVLKPFDQWKNDVQSIASHQCERWLRTEYDTAVIRARQAADWRQFEREADVLPNLKWLPSTSLHPGEDHRPFWGTILPIGHPFWDQHRPGDRWNCKCDLTSTDEPPTPVPAASSPVNGDSSTVNPHRGLENNPGKDAKLFSDSHPYIANAYTGAQEAVQNAVERLSKVNTAIRVKELKAQLDEYKGLVISDENFLTGQIRVLRGSFTSVYEHAIEEETVRQWIMLFSEESLQGWEYRGWAENRPYSPVHPKFDPKNPKKKKHAETDFFLYYSKELGGKQYWANVKMHKDYKGEVLYTIEPNKPEDLIEGLPPNLGKYLQK